MTQIWNFIGEAFSQWGSRSAIAGGASALAIGGVLLWWWVRVRRIHEEREDVPTVILISGSRGKSSTVRLMHAALSAAGLHAFGKTTGTAAAELPVTGPEQPITRFGQVSVVEMQESIHRAMATDPQANVLVLECMAVDPALIALVSQRMVTPDIVVITNVLFDHLEEEGRSLEEIAASMGEAIRPGCLVITGERRPGPLSVLVNLAHRRDATLIQVDAATVSESVRSRLTNAHPQNIALTLAVTRSLSIPDDIAIDGMARTTLEPGSLDVWSRPLGELEVTFTDLGAINDPESLLAVLRNDQRVAAQDHLRIGLLIGRWDRPLRALEFAGVLMPGSFDALVVTGGPVHAIKAILIEAGWAPERIEVAVHFTGSIRMWGRRLTRLAQRVDPGAQRVSVLSLENIHDGGADRLREFCSRGDPVVTS